MTPRRATIAPRSVRERTDAVIVFPRRPPPAMRLIARFLLLMSLVLGLSLAFAWAWDRTEPAPAAELPAR